MIDLMSNDEYRRGWYEWYWSKATDTEKRLWELVSGLSDEYFADFRFEPGTIAEDFMNIVDTDINGEEVTASCAPPDILQYFDQIVLQSFRYKAEPLDDGLAGLVNFVDLTMTIPPEMVNCEDGKPDILHEIIHLYEFALDQLSKFFHDILVISLYRKLKGMINDLDDRIVDHTHFINGERITITGGEHDILFLLKSFDLDLKCGYKLGTVCGYGRDEY